MYKLVIFSNLFRSSRCRKLLILNGVSLRSGGVSDFVGTKTCAKVTFFYHIFITFDKTEQFFVDNFFDI